MLKPIQNPGFELGLDKNLLGEEVQNYIRENINKEKVNKFVNEYLNNVSIGLANLITIFEPEAICFGGSFSYYTDIFIPILEEKIKDNLFNKDTKVKLVRAKLKNDAGIIGASLL